MNWLNTLSPTNLKTLTGCIMALILVLFYCLATFVGKTIDWVVFGEVCAFAAAVMGVAYVGFRTQRKTDYGYVERDGEAKAKVAAATPPPSPSPVTVATTEPVAVTTTTTSPPATQ